MREYILVNKFLKKEKKMQQRFFGSTESIRSYSTLHVVWVVGVRDKRRDKENKTKDKGRWGNMP